jgi:FkbM family methyltransferase
MKLGYEMTVDLRSQTQFLAYYTGEYDSQNIRSVLRLVEPHWTLLDVGANIGFWSVPLASAVKESGRLDSFEPVPSNFRLLSANLNANHLETVVCLHQLGLSDRGGTAEISLREDFAGGSETGNAAMVIDGSDFRFQCAQVHIQTLDDLADSLAFDRLDFMKVDIEGHEHRFLMGAARTVARFRPILFMEINDEYYERQGSDPTKLFQNWLREHSYVSALRLTNQWKLDDLSNRKTRLSDVFFCPEENAREIIARLGGVRPLRAALR